ncbi:MAG: hypothetical protein KIT57_17140 [Blastocatellales bacterium]|nr:hypothetical protein [Blastocatellales bacterium]
MFDPFALRRPSTFCADCGNERAPDRFWAHRYLCADCARRRGHPRRAILTATALGFALIAALQMLRPPPPVTYPPAVSAFDAAGDRLPAVKETEKPERVMCGARTLRGTPCRRLVAPGERCVQHKGRASILHQKEVR